MKMRGILAVCLSVILPVTASAVDLLDVYADAKRHDPLIRQAENQYLSDKEALPQARAGFFPQLSVNGNIQRQKQFIASEVAGFPPRQLYNSHDYTLQASQPIFNPQAWFSVKSAKAVVKQAQAQYLAAQQDLMIRTASAYFNVLEARDTLKFTQAKKRANKRQLEQARQRFKVGLEAVTSVYEAQAAYDASVAEEIASKNDLDNKNEALRNLTGRIYNDIEGFKGPLPLFRPIPNSPKVWVDTAVKQNYVFQAAQYARTASKQNISTQLAANAPVLSANFSMNDRGSSAPGFNGNFTNTRSANLQVSFPFYQGGATLSRTRQAQYDYEVASAKYDEIYRNTVVGARQTFNTVISGISKIRADRQAVKSAKNTVESTEAQFKVGTRTMVDVLITVRSLFEVQRNLAVDQYAYLNATLKLKELAGTLSETDLTQINQLLHKYAPRNRKN